MSRRACPLAMKIDVMAWFPALSRGSGSGVIARRTAGVRPKPRSIQMHEYTDRHQSI